MTPKAWREFRTFGELTKEVQRRVNNEPMERPFEDALISDLIRERHYICGPKALRPHRFKKTPEDSPYRFYGDFERIGWHPVSWRDAASKSSRKQRDTLNDALRLEALAAKKAYRVGHSICERCGLKPPVDTHHEKPTWKDIVDEVISISGDEAVADELARWNWFDLEVFRVSPGGKVKAVFDGIHGQALLEALCKPCHDKA
jgi:hypothetical protein